MEKRYYKNLNLQENLGIYFDIEIEGKAWVAFSKEGLSEKTVDIELSPEQLRKLKNYNLEELMFFVHDYIQDKPVAEIQDKKRVRILTDNRSSFIVSRSRY